MRTRRVLAVLGLLGSICTAGGAQAQDFHVQETPSPANWTPDVLKPGTIAFNDNQGGSADNGSNLISFADWASQQPTQKKFLALFPSYDDSVKRPSPPPPNGDKPDAGAGNTTASGDKADASAGNATASGVKPDAGAGSANASRGKADASAGKLDMYVAQARFLLDRAPTAIDLSKYVTIDMLQKIDPAIKHTLITADDVKPFKTEKGATANDNPDRKWCTGRTSLICIQSTYKLEGKIPIGIMLVDKLRDEAKKIADHIDFESELSELAAADVDQAGLQQLTGLDTPVSGVLEQNVFYVNQILRFAKFFAVFQADSADAGKTVVTAYMALAIEASVLDKKREYENVPVLRNLVPAQVLMGQSSFNSGNSISAGLPKYARNEITTVADLLAKGK